MKLPAGATVVAAFKAADDDKVFTQSLDGWKVTASDDIPSKGRGAGGVMVHKLRQGDETVVTACAAPEFTSGGDALAVTARSTATGRGTVVLDA